MGTVPGMGIIASQKGHSSYLFHLYVLACYVHFPSDERSAVRFVAGRLKLIEDTKQTICC